MKTLNATSLAVQNKIGQVPITIDKIIIFEQWDGEITSVVSTTEIKVSGDATSFFSNDDIVFCPTKDYTTEVTINSNPSYSAGETTLQFTSASFVSTDVGKHIALRINITRKITEDGFGDVIQQIEGSELFEFDSGKMDVILDNKDGHFHSSDKTGILDSGRVFWAKYEIGFRGADDNILYFGGLLDLSDIDPDLYNRTIKVRIYGHTKEIERYPAFYVCDTSENELPKIPGITLVDFTESGETEEGIKRIEYTPFSNSRLKGVSIKSVSDDTPSGIKVLEFRYPFYFKWDNGAWTEVADTGDIDSNGDVKMYAKDGASNSLYALVNFGTGDSLNEYPDSDDEVWINIKDAERVGSQPQIGDSGKPIIKFDNGVVQHIKLHFQRILEYDDSGTSYTDISDDCNTPYDIDESVVSVLDANDDSMIIIASERFWGMEVLLSSLFSASTVTITYSTGGESFSSAMTFGTNGLVDDTSGMTQEGKITWNTADGWIINNIIIDANTNYKGFMIKIERTTASGTCTIREIRRLIRAKGENDDYIEIKFDQVKLGTEGVKDEIILKYSGGQWVYGVWYQNISLQELLGLALDEANYDSSKRTMDNIQVSGATDYFNIWGKPPRLSYPKNPTALYVDDTNSRVFIGAGNELWKCSYTGRWEYCARFWTYFIEWDILKIWPISTDVIYVFLGTKYDKNRYHFYRTVTLKSYTISTGVVADVLPSTTESGFCDGEHFIRNGASYFVTPNYFRAFGQGIVPSYLNYGENLCVPFRQIITPCWSIGRELNNSMRVAADLDTDCDTSRKEWIFDDDEGGGGVSESGPNWDTDMGYYALDHYISYTSECAKTRLRFSFGQQGSWFIDETENDVYAFDQEDGGSDSFWCKMHGWKSGGSDSYDKLAHFSRDTIPCSIAHDISNSILYLSHVVWHDDGDDTVSFSYLTKFKNTRVKNWDTVFHYNNTGTSYTDLTSTCNNNDTGIGTGIIGEVNDMWYFGMDEKFRSIYIDPDNFVFAGTMVYEYWNGSAWVALSDTPDWKGSEHGDTLCWRIPHDWATTSVNSVTRYWIRMRCSVYSSGYMNLNSAWLLEYVVWDSELSNSGNYDRNTPIWMVHNPSEGSVHGCMFNRESTGTDPFKWIYFVFIISTETVVFSSTGDNFTFDGSLVLKNFVYNSTDNAVYCVTEDKRYNEKTSYIIKGEYDAGITLTQVGSPVNGEWGCQDFAIDSGGDLWGITKQEKYLLWQYASTFYPRIELAEFSESDNIKDILKYIAVYVNSHLFIQSDRTLHYIKRGEYEDTMSLKWNKNIVNKGKMDFGYWDHFNDAVKVEWENPIDYSSGNKKLGYTNWLKKVLTISNPLIQSPHTSQFIANALYNYFNSWKVVCKRIDLIYLIQLECLIDRVNFIIPSSILDIDTSKYFQITSIKLSQRNKKITLDGLEL